MKSFFKTLLLSLFTGCIIFTAVPVHAQYGLQQTAQKTPYNNSKTDFFGIIEKVIAGALATVAFIFFGLALYAGIRWMTARGDESLVEKAKNTLRSAIIGLVVMLAAYALTKFVFTQLNTTRTGSVTSPPSGS
jgi:type IV secretory pathway VirB2 component (pilin)